jgi:hypothetical protein
MIFKRVLLASLLYVLAALTGGVHAQAPNVRSILFSGAQSCPASVRSGLPSNVACPKVDFNPATGQAWVQGQGYVPLSSLVSITNSTGGYVSNWDGSLTWKFGPVSNPIRNATAQNAVVMADSTELLTNPTFIGNGLSATGWTPVITGTGSISFSPSSGAQITGDGGTLTTYIWQQISGLTVGRNYVISLGNPGSTSAGIISVGTVAGGTAILGRTTIQPSFAIGGTFSDRVAFTATSTTVVINLERSTPTAGTYVSLSVQDGERIQNGNFAYNPLSASQLTLQNGGQWQSVGGASTVVYLGANQVQLQPDNVNQARFGMPFQVVAGFTYTLTVDIAISTVNLNIGNAFNNAAYYNNNIIGVGQKVQFTPTVTGTAWVTFVRTTTGNATISNVSVQSAGKLPDNWVVNLGSTGLITNIVATAPDSSGVNGNYIDLQLLGTATAGNTLQVIYETSSVLTGYSQNQTVILSTYELLTGGTATGISSAGLEIDERNSAGTFLISGNYTYAIPSSGSLASSRASYAYTLTQPTVNRLSPISRFTVTNGANINATYRLAGPQLEVQSYATQASASPFIPTSGSAATNPAQLRTGLGTGLLREEIRTNLSLWSQSLENAAWTKANGTITADTTVAPDGTTTADTFTAGAGTAPTGIVVPAISFTSGTVYIHSVYAKNGTQSLIQVNLPPAAFGGAGYANVDLSKCSVVSTGGVLVSYGAFWTSNGCRAWIAATATATTSVGPSINLINNATDTRSPTFTGNGLTVSFWGDQVTAVTATSGNAPLSYCPTTSAAATCSADVLTASGPFLSALLSPSISFLAQTYGAQGTVVPRLVEFSVPSGQNVVTDLTSATQVQVILDTGQAATAVLGTGTTPVSVRAAFRVSPSGGAAVANGGTLVSNATPPTTRLALVYIGDNAAQTRTLNGYIQRIPVWAQALPDAALLALSAPQPVLVTDFANGVYTWNGYNIGAAGLSSLFSVSNSGGYCTTSAGLLVSFPANTFRVCAGTGLLPEDTRTNKSTNFNANPTDLTGLTLFNAPTVSVVDMSAALAAAGLQAAVPNGKVYKFVASGSDQGAFFSGTTGNTNPHSISAWVLAESGTVEIALSAGTGAVSTTSRTFTRLTSSNIIPTTSAQSMKIRSIGGAATYYVILNQLEEGAFPTSPIVIAGAPATRNVDNIQALGPVLNLLGTQGANAMVAAWTQSQYYSSVASAARQYALGWTDIGNSRWAMWSAAGSASGGPLIAVGDGTTASTLPASNSIAAGAPVKFAVRWNTSAADLAASTNGGVTAAQARQFGGSIAAPFYIGNINGNGSLNSPLQSLGFYPGGLTNSQLQSASQ